ncbi:hypothetical protein D3C72_1737710 [compost metagenome]
MPNTKARTKPPTRVMIRLSACGIGAPASVKVLFGLETSIWGRKAATARLSCPFYRDETDMKQSKLRARRRVAERGGARRRFLLPLREKVAAAGRRMRGLSTRFEDRGESHRPETPHPPLRGTFSRKGRRNILSALSPFGLLERRRPPREIAGGGGLGGTPGLRPE